MTMYSKKSLQAFVALTALAVSASAFQGVSVPKSRSSQSLSALIYGWDGQPEEDNSAVTSYLDVGSSSSISNDYGGDPSCTPAGTTVAESLSYDRERAGHLARLAVAFSPPERAITLDRVLNVEVICVRDDSIEIQAAICEDHGCVTLHVPVTFPKACFSDDPHNLEGCVLGNLDQLDVTAGALLNKGDECVLDERFEAFPSWWIPLECIDPGLAGDCETVRQLINEAEFQLDVNALAQDALRRIEAGEEIRVLAAKVAILGTAGICFKVQVQHELNGSVQVLDVVHPFDTPTYNVEALRAAVLGAVASAEGK
ncbi:expressed unknown protein [Seminavis robusta]|uniref:Uncharacterized protein n=1 Tax=Seminavis robusta TaxID=568900 RepID=A0A9N8HY99_9STRA|nr:expressed unknown protein [Seminavis robusta]|eukprot:Sro2423_g327220.1 n/a (313) ;mRNA; r:4312-5250